MRAARALTIIALFLSGLAHAGAAGYVFVCGAMADSFGEMVDPNATDTVDDVGDAVGKVSRDMGDSMRWIGRGLLAVSFGLMLSIWGLLRGANALVMVMTLPAALLDGYAASAMDDAGWWWGWFGAATAASAFVIALVQWARGRDAAQT